MSDVKAVLLTYHASCHYNVEVNGKLRHCEFSLTLQAPDALVAAHYVLEHVKGANLHRQVLNLEVSVV